MKYIFSLWKSYSVNITLSKYDITTISGCEAMLMYATEQFNVVGGIFNLYNTLNTLDESAGALTANMRLKVDATRNLDQLSRKLCENLEHFVVMANAGSPLGDRSQILGSMATSVVKGICETRAADGYPAKLVEWGNVQESSGTQQKTGMIKQEISSCLEQLDKLLICPELNVSCVVVDKKSNDDETNILDIIQNLIGLRDFKAFSNEANLLEMGLNSLQALELNLFLQEHYQVNYSLNELNSLTLENLQNLSSEHYKDTKKSNELKITLLDEARGISALLNNFGKQRISSKQILHSLESESIDKSSQLIIIPSLEGSAESAICEISLKLHSNVRILQLNESMNAKSIQQIAESAFNVRNWK